MRGRAEQIWTHPVLAKNIKQTLVLLTSQKTAAVAKRRSVRMEQIWAPPFGAKHNTH